MANTVLESATVNNDVAAVMYNVTCSTEAATAAKTATASTKFALFSGVRVRVTFTNGNTANNPTLNINSSVDVPLKADNGNAVASMNAGTVLDIIYDGTNYLVSNIGTIPPVVKTWAEDKFALKTDALTGVTATSPLSASTSSGVANVTHDNSGVTAGSKGDTTNQTPSFGGTFKALSGTVDAKGHITAFDEHTVTMPSSEATQSASGLMSATDKTKLDGIASGADNVAFTQTQTSGSEIGTISINSTNTKLYAPIQTDVSGNAGTATALQTARLIDGASFDGSSNIIHYGVCSNTGSETTKNVSISSFTGTTLAAGARVFVKFAYSTIATSAAKLNVSGTGAYSILIRDGATPGFPAGYWDAGDVVEFVFSGNSWIVVGRGVASTGAYGVTKLSSSVSSTSELTAATTAAVSSAYALASGKPDLIPTTGVVPLMDGTASVGTSTTAARSDHVHPTDVNLVPIVGKGANILDNWYFVGGGTPGKYPINSGGKLSYAGTATVTIDRWYAYTATISVESSYLEINNSANGSVGYIWQPLKSEVAYALNGQDVTISVFDANGNLTTATFSFAQGTTQIVTDSTADMWIQHGSDDGIYVVANPYKTVRIVAIKFEIGNRQTLVRSVNGTYYLNDIPVNYGEELVNAMTDASDEPVWTNGKGINLLYNAYFIGGGNGALPVNHLGLSSYSNSGYTLDKWWQGPNITLTIEAGDIYLVNADSVNTRRIRQIVPNLSAYKGNSVTGTFLLASGKISTITMDIPASSDTNISVTPTVGASDNAWVNLVADFTNNYIEFNAFVNKSNSARIVAAKLELGNRQTLARNTNGTATGWVLNDPAPNYQVEVLRCSDGFNPIVGKGINLLDNAYFIGGGGDGALPVNQQGYTGANAYSTAGRTVDRWSNYANTNVGVEADGLSFSTNTALFQMIEPTRMRLGETYTLSAIVNGACYSVTFDYAATSTVASLNCGTAYLRFYGDMWSQTPSKNGVGFDAVTGATKVSAVKLELGIRQTLARLESGAWVLNDPTPVYSEELYKCQYYYWRKTYLPYETIGLGVAVANQWNAVVIQLGVARQMNQDAFANTNPAYPKKVLCTITPLNGGGIGNSPPVSFTGFQNQAYCTQSGSCVMYQTTATVTTDGAFYAYANDSTGLIIEVDAEQR